jgi:hypothetical protein
MEASSQYVSSDIILSSTSQRELQVLVDTSLDTSTSAQLQAMSENTKRAIEFTLANVPITKDMEIPTLMGQFKSLNMKESMK